MLPWVLAPRHPRSVDRAGMVYCPNVDQAVEFDRCRVCPYLDEIAMSGDRVVEMTCSPAYGSLAASPMSGQR